MPKIIETKINGELYHKVRLSDIMLTKQADTYYAYIPVYVHKTSETFNPKEPVTIDMIQKVKIQ